MSFKLSHCWIRGGGWWRLCRYDGFIATVRVLLFLTCRIKCEGVVKSCIEHKVVRSDTKFSTLVVVAAVAGDDSIQLHLKTGMQPLRRWQEAPSGVGGHQTATCVLPSWSMLGQGIWLAGISCCIFCQRSPHWTAASVGKGGAGRRHYLWHRIVSS